MRKRRFFSWKDVSSLARHVSEMRVRVVLICRLLDQVSVHAWWPVTSHVLVLEFPSSRPSQRRSMLFFSARPSLRDASPS
mgnify:CR=1 FL=1